MLFTGKVTQQKESLFLMGKRLKECRIACGLSQEQLIEAEVRDRTTVRRDIWDGCGDDSLRGLFLQKMRQRYDAAQDDAERRTVQQAVRFALAAMENRDM